MCLESLIGPPRPAAWCVSFSAANQLFLFRLSWLRDLLWGTEVELRFGVNERRGIGVILSLSLWMGPSGKACG